MSRCMIPQGYVQVLDAYQTQRAIEHIKTTFQREFCAALNLKRVSAPLFVASDSGLNDNLNGHERPVSFDITEGSLDWGVSGTRQNKGISRHLLFVRKLTVGMCH